MIKLLMSFFTGHNIFLSAGVIVALGGSILIGKCNYDREKVREGYEKRRKEEELARQKWERRNKKYKDKLRRKFDKKNKKRDKTGKKESLDELFDSVDAS